MEAIYCDKCGKIFKKEDVKKIEIIGLYSVDTALDLCYKCEDKLKAWIEKVV
jgi:hypothetical protein